MDDETIKNILIILKVNPEKFCEKDYNKETIKYFKEIVKSSDKLYGNEEVNLFSQEKKLAIPIDFANVEYLYVYACYEKNQLAFSPIFNVIESANIF